MGLKKPGSFVGSPACGIIVEDGLIPGGLLACGGFLGHFFGGSLFRSHFFGGSLFGGGLFWRRLGPRDGVGLWSEFVDFHFRHKPAELLLFLFSFEVIRAAAAFYDFV